MKTIHIFISVFISIAVLLILIANSSFFTIQHSFTLLSESNTYQVNFTQAEVDCEDDFDCDDNSYCDLDEEICMPFKANGAACTRDEECISVSCVGGVCGSSGTTTGGTTTGGTTTGGTTTGGTTTTGTTSGGGTTGNLPSSGIFDENPFVLYGLLSMVSGLLFYKVLEVTNFSLLFASISKSFKGNPNKDFEDSVMKENKDK